MVTNAHFTKPLGPRDAGMPMNLDEFEDADYELGFRYELINGVLAVTPPPLEEERDANEELGYMLRDYQKSNPQGKSLDLILPEHNIRTKDQNRRADRAVWSGLGRQPRTRGDVKLRDVPTIVVKFPSARPADQRRDDEENRIECRDAGVREHWIIDRFRRLMSVYRWRRKRWAKQTVEAGETYQSPLLP
jgi:Uma2 family endonuclease